MIMDEAMPREADGRLSLCHFCQRAIYFAGGIIKLLAKDLDREAVSEYHRRARRSWADAAIKEAEGE